MKLIHAARTEKPQCDPYQVLGIAVIRQAADDYCAIARRLNTIGSSEEKHRLEQEMVSLRRFFQGAWYEVLSNSSNGSLILERLDREVYAYAKDTSRKIKAIFHSRMEKGERCTGSAPYGFMAAKVNGVYQLVIDEEAAKVIRRIFSMAAEGKSTREIADALTADKVLVPSAYDQQTEGRPNYRGAVKEPFHWKELLADHP